MVFAYEINNASLRVLIIGFPSSHYPQNKILHSRVEALHIKLAEKDCNSAGISSGSTSVDPLHDGGLQNVVNYLRRSKEIVCVSHLQGFSCFYHFSFDLGILLI